MRKFLLGVAILCALALGAGGVRLVWEVMHSLDSVRESNPTKYAELLATDHSLQFSSHFPRELSGLDHATVEYFDSVSAYVFVARGHMAPVAAAHLLSDAQGAGEGTYGDPDVLAPYRDELRWDEVGANSNLDWATLGAGVNTVVFAHLSGAWISVSGVSVREQDGLVVYWAVARRSFIR